jgi:FtsP/CotA-like multicopper oxidase with cupredoxin domain
VKRRDLLRGVLGAAAAWRLGLHRARPTHALGGATAGSQAVAGGVAQPAARTGRPAIEIELAAAAEEVSILPGAATRVWRFRGLQTSGRSALSALGEDSYLGPTLEVRRGDHLRIAFRNALPEPSIVHWHGLDVAHDDDGHPMHEVAPGRSYHYDFEVNNRAGTYWYHAHPDPRTGPQVYRGLAGAIVVRDDDEERALGLPETDHELLLVLQDRLLDENNQLDYAFAPMIGFLGDLVLVNGRVPEPLSVRRGSYRLRLLNGSNSRIYKLAWSDGSPMVVLATDGGLLDAPRELPYAVLAPGQRLELWSDFGLRSGGDSVTLRSLAFDGVLPAMMERMGRMGRMGGGPMGGRGRGGGMGRGPRGMGMMASGPELLIGQGDAFDIQTFVVSGAGRRMPRPGRLAAPAPGWPPPDHPPLRVEARWQHMTWSLGGRTFEMERVAPDERIPLGAVHDWELFNPPSGMAMAHPIHLHGPQFRVVERSSAGVSDAARTTLAAGLIDDGWLDTILLLPGERIRLRAHYEHHTGLFLYHCHNLEHEDMGMMRNFEVVG